MSAKAEISGVWNMLRILGWVAIAALLVLPLVAMQFTSDVNWTAEDFVAAGVILGGAGLGTQFLVGRSGSNAYRIGAVLAVLAVFLTIWSNLAVGMIGNEDNPYNLLFFGVILLGLAGMVMARFKPAGMALAMAVAGSAQAAAALSGLWRTRVGPWSASFLQAPGWSPPPCSGTLRGNRPRRAKRGDWAQTARALQLLAVA